MRETWMVAVNVKVAGQAPRWAAGLAVTWAEAVSGAPGPAGSECAGSYTTGPPSQVT
ncbi:hypothetical protein [Nonomuraea sp. NPDC050783]|uniref:hypothetical protein n=1 Tax=Nonomuraea sp. NPDC050783 TaxID=3154634 RepID=UPI003466F7FA